MPIEIAALIQLLVLAYSVWVTCRKDRRKPSKDKRRVVVHLAMITLAIFLLSAGLDISASLSPDTIEQIWHFGAVTAALGTGAAIYYSTGGYR